MPAMNIASAKPARPDLSARQIRLLTAGMLGLLTIVAFLIGMLLDSWPRPGTPILQFLAFLGACLLTVPVFFSARKRSGSAQTPNRLFVLHVVCGLSGTFLVCLHGFAGLHGPPVVLFAFLLFVLTSGYVGRVTMASEIASTFGRAPAGFVAIPEETRNQLRNLIAEKQTLLARLDPQALEGQFSVNLTHWLKNPVLSLRYQRLASEERRLMGTRRRAGRIQAWWRPLHLVVSVLFLAGMLLHIILVLFFAGYVAGSEEVYWWHIRKTAPE